MSQPAPSATTSRWPEYVHPRGQGVHIRRADGPAVERGRKAVFRAEGQGLVQRGAGRAERRVRLGSPLTLFTATRRLMSRIAPLRGRPPTARCVPAMSLYQLLSVFFGFGDDVLHAVAHVELAVLVEARPPTMVRRTQSFEPL